MQTSRWWYLVQGSLSAVVPTTTFAFRSSTLITPVRRYGLCTTTVRSTRTTQQQQQQQQRLLRHFPSSKIIKNTMTTTTTTSTLTSTSTKAVRTALDEVSTTGEFKRVEAGYRNWIKNDPTAPFPAESNRYHLYVSYACPWACRALMVRSMKGLQDVISVTVVHPIWQKTNPTVDDHAGWIFGTNHNDHDSFMTNHMGNGGPFSTSYPDTKVDPYTGSKTIRQVYESVQDQGGKYSVPILYDKKTKQIVNNESSEIIRMLNSEFNHLATTNPNLDMYPQDLRTIIDEANEWIYKGINNGVYRCGFAVTQAAYDAAITELTNCFDRLDDLLQKQRYVAGDRLTEADIRLFVTLVRYDEVYVVYFKTNTRSVTNTSSILNYCRDIYQTMGVKETVNMEHIKTHYFCSHPTLNPYSIIPRGNNFLDLLEQPHNRNELFS